MTPLYNPAFACWAIRCSPPECAVLIFLCCRHQAPRYPFAGFGHEQPAGTHRRAFLPIKTPKQLIVTAILAFVVPIGIIILLVNMVVSGTKVGAGSDTLTPEAVTKRIAPVAGFELVDANAPKVFKTGEQVFAAVCTACHTAGVAGAPKIGDNAAWAPFIKAGYESPAERRAAWQGGMPAKGGNPTLSDYEVARAVVYMANKSGASLPEPAAPAEEGAKKEEAAAPAAAAPAPPRRLLPLPPGRRGSRSRSARPAAAAPRNRPPSTRPAKSSIRASASPVTPPAWPTRRSATGRLGALHQDRHGRDGEDRHAGQAAHAAKGGAATATEEDIRAAVQYMVDAAK